MEWNKEARIVKTQPAVNKLVAHFKSKGISFEPSDGELENVVFTSKDKVVKIAHRSFYRYSGMAVIYKDKGENEIEAIQLTDDMYMDMFMKPIVEVLFKSDK